MQSKNTQGLSVVGRTLPHSLEAEKAVLGCVLVDNNATASGFSRLSQDDFYSPTHKIIFNAMLELLEANSVVDFVTLVSKLTHTGKLEEVGGLAYITVLNDAVPSSSSFKHYLEILTKNRILRKLVSVGNQVTEQGYTAGDARLALSAAETAIFGIGKEEERRELTPISNHLPEVIAKFDEIHKNPDSVRGLKCGFNRLDSLTNGFQKSDLIILAARPSVGKTALGLNMILNAALYHNAKCAVFSLEMSKSQLTMRATCSVAQVSLSKALKGELNTQEWKQIFTANKALENSGLYLDDNSVITPAEIQRKCMRLKREHGLDFVMIDYLGLMTGGGTRRESRQVEVSDNSRNLKIMAKELNVPVLLLAQLNRGIESRKGPDAKPVLSDLRESGSIEQDADIVMFIHKEKHEGETQQDPEATTEAEIVIAKHRNGPLANIPIGWDGKTTTFFSK